MAKRKRDWGGVFVGIISTVSAVGVAALLTDWLKATGKWPGTKPLTAGSDFGCDSGCVGSDEDPIVKAGQNL